MLQHIFTCEKCKKEIPYNLIRISARVKCPHCDARYYVSKSYLVYMLEMVVLFVVGAMLYGLLQSVPQLQTDFIRMLLLLLILYMLFALLDILLDKVFHYKKLFILIRKD